MPELYVLPPLVRFRRGQESELARLLTETDKVTATQPVGSARPLALGADGALEGGYRYTIDALKQLCQLLSPGLWRVVADVSGVHRQSDRPRSDYSFVKAVELFNSVLHLRFSGRFGQDYRMVRNAKEKRIEGFLGAKYSQLENVQLYELAGDAVRASPLPVEFREATVAGRRLLLRYSHTRPLFLAATGRGKPEPEPFHGGFHFSNSEIAGEAPVKAATLLVRATDGTAAIGSFPANRMAHLGSDFAAKLRRMFQAALAAPQDARVLGGNMQRLAAAPLGLGGDESARAAHMNYLSLVLHREGIPRSLGRRIVLMAANRGDMDVDAPATSLSVSAMAGRTYFDLYACMTRQSRKLDQSTRESVEQAAHRLLCGSLIKFTK